MGCCASAPEPKKIDGSVSFTSQAQQKAALQNQQSGGAGRHPGHPGGGGQVHMGGHAAAGPYRHQPAPQSVPANPFQRVGPTPGGALTFVALFDYEARTAEDLSFHKGTLLDSRLHTAVSW